MKRFCCKEPGDSRGWEAAAIEKATVLVYSVSHSVLRLIWIVWCVQTGQDAFYPLLSWDYVSNFILVVSVCRCWYYVVFRTVLLRPMILQWPSWCVGWILVVPAVKDFQRVGRYVFCGPQETRNIVLCPTDHLSPCLCWQVRRQRMELVAVWEQQLKSYMMKYFFEDFFFLREN